METTRTEEGLNKELVAESRMGLTEQVAEMRGILSQLVERFNHLEHTVEVRLDRTDSRIDRVEERMDRNFLWTIGIVLTTWITLMVTILVKT